MLTRDPRADLSAWDLFMQCFPVFLHSADYIFISFGIIGPIVVALKMEFCWCILEGIEISLVLQSSLLLMKSLDITETRFLFKAF